MLNEKLIKANKELANINWITSHDLKEPLRKILVFSSKVLGEEHKKLSEGIINSIGKIQQSARRMQTLVNDIVSYSLTDDKNAAFSQVDLQAVIADVVAEYESEITERGITITNEKLPSVHGIGYQLRQLFINLIGNSIKFAKKDDPLVIDIRCREITNGGVIHPLMNMGKYYLIELSDNGIGFDPQQGEKIFDIFYRLNDRNDFEGTGIGLAICKRIVENHQGYIRAIGTKGVGASFKIYLPQ